MAQTSASHMAYLRVWASRLGVPILSVDYSLSPGPRPGLAADECFYAYCWLQAHAHELGVRPDRIILSGDSAGGASRFCFAQTCTI